MEVSVKNSMDSASAKLDGVAEDAKYLLLVSVAIHINKILCITIGIQAVRSQVSFLVT